MHPRNPCTPASVRLAPLLLACVGVLGAWGCASKEPGPEARRVDPPVIRDVPQVLRGTIGAECSLRGTEPVLVSGLGIVAGLNGTGGGPLNPAVAATMERELARGGIGKGGVLNDGPLAGKTPRQVLEDPNVAVVVVEGVIAPGAPDSWRFDVRVSTLPGSSVTSLEGGTLWTTDLRLGPAAVFGQMQTRKMGIARGPIFINPFTTPGSDDAGASGINRTAGRILDGGIVSDPIPMELVLDNPSHQRASSIQTAINARLGTTADDPVARAKSDTLVTVRIPRNYRDRSGEFVQLLRFMQIDTAFPQDYARRYAQELKDQPGLADQLGWCLQALGKPAIPFVQPLYELPELAPRLMALRTGARLGDVRAVPGLKEIAQDARMDAATRSEALALMGRMGSNPFADAALREMVDSPDLPVRVSAYESMSMRNDPLISRVPVEQKFWLDSVPAKEPLVYVSQQGTPRIVLFGDSVRINKPILVSAWEDRLLLTAQSESEPLRLYYKDYRSGKVTQQRVPDDVRALAAFLGRADSPEQPEPGLGLSYSEVVGALYEMQRQGAIPGAFSTENDRLLATITSSRSNENVEDRPESSAQREARQRDVRLIAPAKPAGQPAGQGPGERKPMLVPLGGVKKDPESK